MTISGDRRNGLESALDFKLTHYSFFHLAAAALWAMRWRASRAAQSFPGSGILVSRNDGTTHPSQESRVLLQRTYWCALLSRISSSVWVLS